MQPQRPRYSIKAILLLGVCLAALHFHPLRHAHALLARRALLVRIAPRPIAPRLIDLHPIAPHPIALQTGMTRRICLN